jgi:hypothetical protein
VHKDTITVALAEDGQRGDVRESGKIANTPVGLNKLLDKLERIACLPRLCYEAGPCGYGIHRQVTAAANECVAAPSLIPRNPGQRTLIPTLHREGNFAASKACCQRSGNSFPSTA